MSKARDIADLNFDSPDIDGGTIDGATINATGLTVDTDTLYVDSTHNRVGIGVTVPTAKLHVECASGSGGRVLFGGSTSSGYNTHINVTDTGMELWAQSNIRGITFSTGSTQTERMVIGDDGVLTVNNNIRMPWSSGKYIIGPVPRASNAFLTSFDSLEINGADGVAGGQAMAGGSVIIRGGDGVTNSGTNSYAGSVTIAGGQHIGSGLGSGTGSVKIQTSGVDRLTVSGGGIATFTGNSSASEGNLRSTSSSGHSYIGVNRDTAGQGELGYSWNTGGATKWWNYLAANSDEMRWYSDGANRLTLTQSGHLTAGGGITSSGALNQTGETQSNISSVFLGTQKLGNNKTLYTYDHYDISWNTSTETKNIFEVSHDTANWGTKYIMIEVFQTMYGGGGYARYYLNHQYNSNTLVQIEKNGSNSNVTAQMTGLTTVTGNVKKSTFQLVLGYYQEAYVRVTSTMSASTSITAANQLRFL